MSASVIVTYSSPQSFLASQWPALRDGLQSQLPLRSVHWKPPSGPSVRTIQELLIDFVAFDSTREAGTSQIPSNLLAKPLLNVYFVSCEDAESYKGPVRKQVKDWHALATQRKNQEWVIVHVVKADSKNAAAGFFQRGNVLDKLRADFNTDKRDRCVQLAWPVSQTNPVAWAEVLSKMKDGILSAFDSLVSQREDEVKRSEQQRLMPGWNFCTFFLLKESLAISYDSMNLLDDALRQYDQLEASFLHVVRERNLSWFGALIVPSPKDDSAPLLSVTRKSYQDLILGNTISVFDLRIYMLAREAALLARVGKLAKVCQKVHEFLVSFGRQLWEAENILPAHFIESWTYSSALSTIEQVEAWSKDVVLEGQALAVFNASKAELLELARHQLDILGVRVGHLPSRTPFTLAVSPERPAPNAIDKRASRIISHPQLMSCLHNKDAFYDLYIGLSNQAIDLYAKAGRRKFALKIHGSLAALDVHRGNLEPALQTYSSLPAHYSPYKWASLESYMLTQAINLHAEACSSKDAQWITLALSFLKNYVHNHGRDLLTSDRDALAYVSTIVDSLKSVVDGLESELVESEHPIFSFRIPNTTTRRVDDEDGCYLDIVAENRLPCEVPVDSINIILSGRGAQRLKFTSHVDSLAPGSTMVTLFCPTSSWGSYLHEATEARISHLSFRWEHRPMSRSKSRARKVAPTVVHLLHDLRALDVRVRRPRLIILGSPPSILLTVTSGRNDIVRMTIKLTSPSSVSFRCQEARFEDSDIDRPKENLDDAIILKDLDKDSVVPILVPYGETSQSPSIQVDLSVTYTTLSRPDIERSLSLTSRIPTVLPVRVNVEDFFRGSRLFSSFTISTTSTQYIRMASTDLKVTDGHNGGLSILKTNPQGQKVATVMPGRPVNALFSLEAKDDSEVDSLQLCIRYRMLRDEVEAVLEETIDSVITDEAVRHKLRTTFLAQLVEALESDPGWVEVYTTTGELHVPSIDGQNETQEMLMSICTALRNLKPIGVDYGTWRELRIPVDLPLRNVLAAARLSISSPSSTKEIELRPSIYAGQPVSALVSIHTTLNWGHSSQAPRKKYRLRFEINELVRDWLVSGRKRGDFEATDGGTYTTYVTLIPLHHGELPLPTVAVTPLPLEGEMTMGSLSLPSCDTHQIHGAEVVLVLPRGGRSTYVVDMGDGVS